jgi:membrane-associated phospholipid phosphatase
VRRSAILQWVIAIAVAVIAIALAFHFDAAVREFIGEHQSRALWSLAENVSKFGDWPAHFIIGALLAVGACWRGSKKWTRVFVAMLIALAIAGGAARGLKIATARARPSVKIEELVGRSHFSPKYHSFPSGHVAASTAFFAVLVFASWRIGLATLAIPLLIAWSRMYGGAHYLSDVVCAAVLGVVCAAIAVRFVLLKIDPPPLKLRRTDNSNEPNS